MDYDYALKDPSSSTNPLQPNQVISYSSSPQNTVQKLSIPSFSSFNPEHQESVLDSKQEQVLKVLDSEIRKEKRSKRKHSKERKSKKLRVDEPKNYFIDTTEVKMNLIYGTVHGAAIPEYQRQSRVILGPCSPTWRIDVKASRNSRFIVVYTTNARETFGSISKRYQEFKEAFKVRPTRIKVGSLGLENSDGDFIPLPLDIVESFEKMQKVEMDAESFRLDHEYTQESKEIRSKLDLDPHDISLWMQLIRLQDSQKSNRARGTNEKKLSIFEKALEFNPTESRLLTGYMECYQEIHDMSVTLNKWDEILYENPCNLDLWKVYLNLRMSHYSSFSVSSCLEVFQECLESFSSSRGYEEKAIALYQALIELNCFCPMAYQKQSLSQRIQLFEDFWEKDLPRFGQTGALGWANSLFKESPEQESMRSIPDFVPDECDSERIQWLKKEKFNAFYEWEPLIDVTQESVQDPYRTVLFDDIKPFLIEVVDCKKELIADFLALLGFPIWKRSVEGLTCPLMSTFLKKDVSQLWDYPLHSPVPTFGHLFPQKDWFPLLAKEQVAYITESGAYKKEFIRNVFAQLQSLRDVFPSFVYPSLVFESFFDYKHAYKYAKSLLKTDRENLILWNALAHLEQCQGKEEEAIRIYSTALEAHHSMRDSSHSCFLYSGLAEIYFKRGDIQRGVSILCSFVDGMKLEQEPSPIRLLRTRTDLQSRVANSHAMEWTSQYFHMYLLLEYYTTQSLQPLLDYILACSSKVSETVLEQFYERLAQLIYIYVSLSPGYQPKLVRQGLEQGLRIFPENTMLLSLYGWTEMQMHLENRVRRFLDLELSMSSHSLSLWLFFIWSEYHQKSQINVHYIRSLLNRALEQPRLCICGSLWLLYIEFEIQQSAWENVKSLIFRSIRSCPWYKELYIKACMCAHVFEPDEMKQIMALMHDKEIRSRNVLDCEF